MTSVNPISFTLVDGTIVCVNKKAENKYDFELRLRNGNRKTFVWSIDMPIFLRNAKGKIDALASEAVERLKSVI